MPPFTHAPVTAPTLTLTSPRGPGDVTPVLPVTPSLPGPSLPDPHPTSPRHRSFFFFERGGRDVLAPRPWGLGRPIPPNATLVINVEIDKVLR